MVLTRSKSRSTEAHLPEELVVCILSRMAEGQTSAYNVASDLRSCALVCSTSLEENTSGTADALDNFEDTAYESTGFLYEVGFRWLVNPDDDVDDFDEDADDGADDESV